MVARRTAPPPLPALLSLALLGAMLTGCSASAAGPTPERLTGDAEVIDVIDSNFAEDWDRAAVALIDGDEVRTAFVAADETTSFEIASITKVLTGELLAIAIERGEVALDDPLGMHLDLGNAPVASVTLRQLVTHHGGIPSDAPEDPEWSEAFLDAWHDHADPIDDDLDELLRLAQGQAVHPDPAFEYTDLGIALLGHALAEAAGTTYSELLGSRVLEPLHMDGAVVVERDEDVPESHAGGFTRFGDPVEAWSVGAWVPAGGVNATLGDLVVLAQAVLDGPLAESDALEPIADAFDPNRQIGYCWFTDVRLERTLTFQDGESGGFTSSLVIDRAQGSAAVVLANSIGDRSRLAFDVLLLADD